MGSSASSPNETSIETGLSEAILPPAHFKVIWFLDHNELPLFPVRASLVLAAWTATRNAWLDPVDWFHFQDPTRPPLPFFIYENIAASQNCHVIWTLNELRLAYDVPTLSQGLTFTVWLGLTQIGQGAFTQSPITTASDEENYDLNQTSSSAPEIIRTGSESGVNISELSTGIEATKKSALSHDEKRYSTTTQSLQNISTSSAVTLAANNTSKGLAGESPYFVVSDMSGILVEEAAVYDLLMTFIVGFADYPDEYIWTSTFTLVVRKAQIIIGPLSNPSQPQSRLTNRLVLDLVGYVALWLFDKRRCTQLRCDVADIQGSIGYLSIEELNTTT